MAVESKLPNKYMAAILACCCYIVAMAFFAIVRVFGLLWFQQEYVQDTLPLWVEGIVMCSFLVFEAAVILRILTPIRWRTAILIGTVYKALCFLFTASWLFFLADILFTVCIPLIFNKDKERSIGYSLLFFVCIFVYQCLMTFGRGYPALSKFNPIWQLLGTIDYKLFLLLILYVKGVATMFGAGCFFLFGKFDQLAQRIGHAVLYPFTRRHDA